MNTCIAYAFFSYHELDCVPQAEPPARNTLYRGQCRIQGIWNISHPEILAPSYCMQNILKYILHFNGCLSPTRNSFNSFMVRHLFWFYYFPFEWNIIDWVNNFWALVYSWSMIKKIVCNCLMKKYDFAV